MIYDAAWFISTPMGKKYESISDDDYFLALLLATNDARMINVSKYCPKIFDEALALQIDALLQELFHTEGGVTTIDGNGDAVAYVTSDKVYDTQRNYTLMQRSQESVKATPSGRLALIYSQCKGARIAMHLALKPSSCGCKQLGDTYAMYADHINTYYNHGL
ncbi:hypothetical protein GCM10009007_03390 [Formosimonas limnophila]|uniref:Uncharacterized protein n=1 Tax=Formosimonas limnophila TaxID=1384487 RepID=A0A8J3CFM0_9BURK|nr:hypothetical protein [Formosimonas limnophila]GHA66250.1 hypothetical protein GCM10009007_03390 [Formosimonas limnophila]